MEEMQVKEKWRVVKKNRKWEQSNENTTKKKGKGKIKGKNINMK